MRVTAMCGRKKNKRRFLEVYDSAPDKEFDELELWRRDDSDSDCLSATRKILSASELIDPKGEGE